MLVRGVILLIATATATFAQSIAIGDFESLGGKPEVELASTIRNLLLSQFVAEGFRAELVSVPSSDMPVAQGADLTIVGQYIRTENGLLLYGQIFTERGMIEAYSLETDLPLYRLNDQEMLESDRARIERFGKRVVARVKTNPRSILRADNIAEHFKGTRVGTRPAKIAKADADSQDAFKVFREGISVASNVADRAEKQPAAVTVITRSQVKSSGARTVNELLTTFVPGYFAVEDQDDVIAGFRGLAPDNNSKVLLLINGHNMNAEWFGGPPDSLLNGMSLEYIERIEVIRGPGSVTLGQGALLGVINIVTRNADNAPGVGFYGAGGQNGFGSGSIQAGATGQVIEDLKAFVLFQATNYSGQKLRDEGWAHDRTFEGVEGWYDARVKPGTASTLEIYKDPAQSGSRLKRGNNRIALAELDYAGLAYEGIYTDQLRDYYNFYRDRDEYRNVVFSNDVSYKFQFSPNVFAKARANYATDDSIYQSHGGHIMGGTREARYGGSTILRWNAAHNRNRLGVGGEYRRYDMGQPDVNGNNFIVNKADTTLFDDVNRNHRYVFPSSIIVYSAFAEDFFALTPSLEFFGAVRYDKHPYWGGNLSPRIGLFYDFARNLRTRFSYQEGFRGSTGVSYSGGFQGDGLLRASNYDKVALSRIPTTDQFNQPTYYGNIANLEPEKIRTYELAFNYEPGDRLSFDAVTFYNTIQKVIDVGVIYADPTAFKMPRIGTDVAGDWNGYFFFRNLPGVIHAGGAEASGTYKLPRLSITLSHSVVRVLTVSDSMYFSPYNGGMYLTNKKFNPHFRAFPENITRAHVSFTPRNWTFGVNYLYYANWYSPVGNRIEGNHILNGNVGYTIGPRMEISLIVKNMLAEGALYPMNSNAGDAAVSDGSPALEGRTYLVQ
ncbi:MAG TPA: TonB-dependent receptor, partial [Leptospiraceae bacterium]|nr:TonB-dependent receptor [Leptospiraceae bacterium]